jgi:O-antigen/teichoic acid export membrane protein
MPSASETLASRLGRHAALYGATAVVGFAMSIVNVAVLTRFLDPAEFGRLALALSVASLLTVLYNLGIVQGTNRAVFGASGEEGDEDADGEIAVGDRRGALGSAVVLTLLIAVAGTIVIWALSGPVARAAHLDGETGLVRWAAVSGGAGAIWRLLANLIRLERRPVGYLVASTARPVLAVGAAVPLVANGRGAQGAMAGIALGTLASLVLALVMTRTSYRLTLLPHLVGRVGRLGASMVPVAIAFWVLQYADVWVLAHYASAGEVGRYRVASRFGALFLYFNSAFMMAYGPLLREPIRMAVEREKGRGPAAAGIARYYVLAALWVVLGLAALAPALVRIAGSQFGDASDLIPLTALAGLAHGLFLIVYRTVLFGTRRTMFIIAASTTPITFVLASLVLAPGLGARGVALAVTSSQLVGAAALLCRSQWSADRVPYDWPRLAGAAALAAACFGASVLARRLPGGWEYVGEAAAVLAYPLIALGAGLVPRAEARTLGRVVRSLVPDRRARSEVRGALARLTAGDVALLSVLIRHRIDPRRVAAALGMERRDVLRRLVGVLRGMGPGGSATAADEHIGAYLVHRGAVAERDALARSLWSEGADPLEVDTLATIAGEVRAVPARSWPGDAAGPCALALLEAEHRAPVIR